MTDADLIWDLRRHPSVKNSFTPDFNKGCDDRITALEATPPEKPIARNEYFGRRRHQLSS